MTRNTPAGWRYITTLDRWAIVSYITAAAWATAFFLLTPDALTLITDRLLIAMQSGAIIVGATLAAIGRWRALHLGVELPGLVLMLGGVLTYATLQLVAAEGTPDGWGDRAHLLFLLLWLVTAAIIPRLSWYVIKLLQLLFPQLRRRRRG